MIAKFVRQRPKDLAMDPMYVIAKTDLLKMVGVLQLCSDKDGVGGTMVAELSKYL